MKYAAHLISLQIISEISLSHPHSLYRTDGSGKSNPRNRTKVTTPYGSNSISQIERVEFFHIIGERFGDILCDAAGIEM